MTSLAPGSYAVGVGRLCLSHGGMKYLHKTDIVSYTDACQQRQPDANITQCGKAMLEHAFVLKRTHARAYANKHTCMHALAQAHSHACAHTQTHTNTHKYTHTHAHAHAHACTQAYTCTHTHAHTHTHTHHTHTHSHTHTHTRARVRLHARTHAQRHTHTQARTHTHTRTRMCTHTTQHTHTYAHTEARICAQMHTHTLAPPQQHVHTNIHTAHMRTHTDTSNDETTHTAPCTCAHRYQHTLSRTCTCTHVQIQHISIHMPSHGSIWPPCPTHQRLRLSCILTGVLHGPPLKLTLICAVRAAYAAACAAPVQVGYVGVSKLKRGGGHAEHSWSGGSLPLPHNALPGKSRHNDKLGPSTPQEKLFFQLREFEEFRNPSFK